jgi:hypothetical protein
LAYRNNGKRYCRRCGPRHNERTWEEWNAGIEKLMAELESRSIPYVRVLLDVEEIEQFCEEQGIPNDAEARSKLALRKAE